MKWLGQYRAILGPLAVVGVFLLGMRLSPVELIRPEDPSGAPAGTVSWLDADWRALERTLEAASAASMDTLAMGELMAAIGQTLVGTPYVPGTLEVEGPERLVVNLRELDCVTFVENVYALAVLVKTEAPERLANRAGVEGEYERALRAVRYRNNAISGYPSRLHYFSEWIADGERKKLMEDITASLGGSPDEDPVHFMSSHSDAYRQLADPDNLEAIRATEAELSAAPRFRIPQERIADVASGIENGDIIAATSTVDGLDVAHTGLALWVEGELHLMHAPLVGEAVEVSPVSLAERIQRIDGQDGLMVARVLEPRRIR